MEKNVIQINGGITIHVDVSVKNVMYVKKIIFGILYMQLGKGKYLESIMDDWAITCDETVESHNEETKIIPKKCNEKKATCKMQNVYILLASLLITIALLIAISI